MSGFVFAAPPAPPPAPVEAWRGLSVEWRGWDGSVWDLTDPASGVFLRAEGVEGLASPKHTQWVASSPAVHGQSYRGHVVDPREVFWPVLVYGDSSDEWLERDRAFWRSLHPGKHGTWTVTTPDGGSRSLDVRFVDDGQHAFGLDPVRAGWASYGVTLVADDPFWTGEPLRRTWAASEPVDFFGGASKAPLFHISSASSIGSASMTNSGDVEAWPVWTVRGPATSVTVGVGGATVQWNVALVEGDILVIDTDPRVQSAWLNGIDVTSQLGSADFAPIPAGEDRTLSLALVGAGSVQAEIRPRHYRAF